MAEELNVDLTKIKGSGFPDGRITKNDVVAAIPRSREECAALEAQVLKHNADIEAAREAYFNRSTYPKEAPEPGNQSICICLQTLRSYEIRLLYNIDVDNIGIGKDGKVFEPMAPDLSESDIFNIGFPYITSVLNYAVGGRVRRTMLDDRIFKWVQSLAVQFNNRLLRDREAWLSKTLALKNVRYLK